ncbi:hypothetical protein [Mycolicibacterium setense]|uniref:hypothetical protein n=1 Tax=Mycolicibacterium setense TaxID=431269 RepID=UPI000A5F8852|nr:hypothetical protein [Mycolicibacterium setense]
MSPTILHGKKIDGIPTANSGEVTAAAAKRKAAEETATKAAEKADLRRLEAEVKQSLQDYFDDSGNGKGTRIRVFQFSLIKVAENLYEGMATMTANGGRKRTLQFTSPLTTGTSFGASTQVHSYHCFASPTSCPRSRHGQCHSTTSNLGLCP